VACRSGGDAEFESDSGGHGSERIIVDAPDWGCCRPLRGHRLVGVGGGVGERGREPRSLAAVRAREDVGGEARRGRRSGEAWTRVGGAVGGGWRQPELERRGGRRCADLGGRSAWSLLTALELTALLRLVARLGEAGGSRSSSEGETGSGDGADPRSMGDPRQGGRPPRRRASRPWGVCGAPSPCCGGSSEWRGRPAGDGEGEDRRRGCIRSTSRSAGGVDGGAGVVGREGEAASWGRSVARERDVASRQPSEPPSPEPPPRLHHTFHPYG